MYFGLSAQDSSENLAPALAGKIILPSRSVAIELLYRGGRGGMYYGLLVQDSHEILVPA